MSYVQDLTARNSIFDEGNGLHSLTSLLFEVRRSSPEKDDPTVFVLRNDPIRAVRSTFTKVSSSILHNLQMFPHAELFNVHRVICS